MFLTRGGQPVGSHALFAVLDKWVLLKVTQSAFRQTIAFSEYSALCSSLFSYRIS